jgi:cell division protein FtsX
MGCFFTPRWWNMRKAQGLVGGLIGIFIFAIIATALLPTIADQVNTAQGGNLTSTDDTLLGLWPTFIVIGGLIAILAAVGLS